MTDHLPSLGMDASRIRNSLSRSGEQKSMEQNSQGTEGMKIGYARVSTEDQRMDLQIDALRAAGVEEDWIYHEKTSGKRSSRPALDECMKCLRRGDTLVVYKMDRLGRSLKELVNIMERLDKHNIGFKSLTEAIDTTTAGGRLVFHIFAALAQFEREIIVERTEPVSPQREREAAPVDAHRS